MSFIEKLDKFNFYCLCGYAIFCSISIAISNIFIGLAVLGVIVQIINNKKNMQNIRIPKVYLRAFVVFFITMFVLIFFSDDLKDAIQRFYRFFSKLFPLLLAITVLKEKKQITRIIVFMIISVTITDLYAIWQGVKGNFRAGAFFTHPMYLAGILVQFLPALFLSLFTVKKEIVKYIVLVFVIGGSAIIFNGTRGAWGALIATIALITFLYGKNIKKTLVYSLFIGVFLAAVFHSVPSLSSRINTVSDMQYQSNSERILMWESAWHMFQDHPFIGVGLGRYEYYYQNQYILPEAKERGQGHAHSNFIHLLAETGIIGLSSFCFMFGSILFYSLKDWLTMRRISSLMFFAATCGLLFQGLTETNFGNGVVMQIYYFLMGIYLQFNYLEKKNIDI